MVEAAFVGLTFFTLFCLLVEGSALLRDYLGVNNVTKTAGRTATVNGNEVYADYYVLRTIRKEAAAIGIDDLQRVVVYKATALGNPPTEACKTASVAGVCNGYTRADLLRPQTDFACRSATALDGFWCPSTRKVAKSGTNGPPDYIGIWVRYTHDMITGLFKGRSTLTDHVVIRLEPRQLT
jgi:hypothetical protein